MQEKSSVGWTDMVYINQCCCPDPSATIHVLNICLYIFEYDMPGNITPLQNSGKTPIQLAQNRGLTAVVQMMQKLGGK